MELYYIVDVLKEAWEEKRTLYFDRFYNPYTEEEVNEGTKFPIIDEINTSECKDLVDVFDAYIKKATYKYKV